VEPLPSEFEVSHRDTGKILAVAGPDSAGRLTFSSKKLSYANLAGMSLPKVELQGADLSHADLTKADLSHANLAGVTLFEADLSHAKLVAANLSDARLSWAKLDSANLTDANLKDTILRETSLRDSRLQNVRLAGAKLYQTQAQRANLRYANLEMADLYYADLTDADLGFARLESAIFTHVYLSGANFENSKFHTTVIQDCPSLGRAVGLEKSNHWLSTTIDALTLRACITKLPDLFLLGAGYTPFEIENLRAMYGSGIEFYSCFLSYAHTDGAFADRIHADLVQAGVSCWQDKHDMRGGEFWREQIRDQIRVRDKVVVVCSKDSIGRVAVIEEIIAGMREERRSGQKKLFPIRLDDYIFTDQAEDLAGGLPDNLHREDWLQYLRDYHVPDFSCWETPAYQPLFRDLLRDLKAKS
jgi:uncharacterized protein YjbI with pentapeptide repeats